MRYVYVQTYRRVLMYVRVCVFVVYVGTQFDVCICTMHVHHAWDVMTNALLYVRTWS